VKSHKYKPENTSFKNFSLKERLVSFSFAFKGIKFFFTTQHNTWIHSISTIIVVVIGIYLKISATEWCLIIFAIGLVFVSELFNSSIELLTDLVSPEFNPKAGLVKDLAAAAVLLSAITAFVIGLIIFWPKIF